MYLKLVSNHYITIEDKITKYWLKITKDVKSLNLNTLNLPIWRQKKILELINE